MINAVFLIPSLLVGLSFTHPVVDYVLHEQRTTTHPRWERKARLHPDSILPMRIGLTQSNLDKAEEFLMKVSHPGSSSYGMHWTAEKVTEAFKPSDSTVKVVRDWLIDHGISPEGIAQSANKQWLAFDATRDEAETLLRTQYHEYRDTHTGNVQAACEEYSVPSHVQAHIDYVTPGIGLLALSSNKAKTRSRELPNDLPRNNRSILETEEAAALTSSGAEADDLGQCDQIITPACIRALYNITERKAPPQERNSLGIFEQVNQTYQNSDLDNFFSNYSSSIPNGTQPILRLINGSGVAPVGDIETSLDLQVAYPIVYPQNITLFANGSGFGSLLDATDGPYCSSSAYGEKSEPEFLPHKPLHCGAYNITNVVSYSYSLPESLTPIKHQKRQCLEFLKLGLRGVTLLIDTGDWGVGGLVGRSPYNTSRTGCIGPKENIFDPRYPANCPWVTSVGGTEVYPGHLVTDPGPELAWLRTGSSSNFSSGGGFSNIYETAAYQNSAVQTYLHEHTPPYLSYDGITNDNLSSIGHAGPSSKGGLFNRAGRGIPDVAAVAENIATYVRDGEFHLSGGTSAATPIFAAMITRINDERIAAGKGPVGFINPVLYGNPQVFRDITNGSNPSCGTNGFEAVKGWDPVTGLGTPNYGMMLDLFTGLP